MTKAQIRKTEAGFHQPRYRRIHGEGEFNDVDDDIIFHDWSIVPVVKDEKTGLEMHVPTEAKILARGLDWGGQAGRSKMAIVALYEYKDGYLLDEEFYEEKSNSTQVANFLKERPNSALVIADIYNNQEAIDNIRQISNCDVRLAAKGSGSVRNSIEFMNRVSIYVTKQSSNLQRERKLYVWTENKFGHYNFRPKPNLKSPHDLLDATRYAFEAIRGLHGVI